MPISLGCRLFRNGAALLDCVDAAAWPALPAFASFPPSCLPAFAARSLFASVDKAPGLAGGKLARFPVPAFEAEGEELGGVGVELLLRCWADGDFSQEGSG